MITKVDTQIDLSTNESFFDTDPNPWEDAFNSAAFPVVSAVLGSYALSVAILAAWKLTVSAYSTE